MPPGESWFPGGWLWRRRSAGEIRVGRAHALTTARRRLSSGRSRRRRAPIRSAALWAAPGALGPRPPGAGAPRPGAPGPGTSGPAAL